MYNAHSGSVLSTLYADGQHSFFITKCWEQFKCPVTEDKLWCPLKYNPAYNTSDISEGIFVVLMLCSERVKMENRLFTIVSIIHAHTYTERGKK